MTLTDQFNCITLGCIDPQIISVLIGVLHVQFDPDTGRVIGCSVKHTSSGVCADALCTVACGHM